MQNYCLQRLASVCSTVLCPDAGEILNVTSETNVFKIKLTEEVLKSIEFAQVGEYRIGYVDAKLRAPTAEELQDNQYLMIDSDEAQSLTVEVRLI